MAAAANSMVSDSTVIDKMTTGLIEKIPATISEMGISADLTKVFQKHAFVVSFPV